MYSGALILNVTNLVTQILTEQFLTLLHSERPKLYASLVFLSAIGLIQF